MGEKEKRKRKNDEGRSPLAQGNTNYLLPLICIGAFLILYSTISFVLAGLITTGALFATIKIDAAIYAFLIIPIIVISSIILSMALCRMAYLLFIKLRDLLFRKDKLKRH